MGVTHNINIKNMLYIKPTKMPITPAQVANAVTLMDQDQELAQCDILIFLVLYYLYYFKYTKMTCLM